MRTKILLAAAAAMAAGMVASNAQVYSANVVGYVNVVLPGNGAFTLVATPFDDGNGNYLTNLVNSALPGGAPAVRSSIYYLSGGVPTTVGKTAAGWASSPQLPPGTGFYIKNGGAGAPDLTNTFVGTVVVNSGGSTNIAIPAGFSLTGSLIPYAGNIAIGGQAGGDANLNYGTVATIGTGTGTSKITYLNAGVLTSVSKLNATHLWGSTVAVVPAQGFWIYNATVATNFVQNAIY